MHSHPANKGQPSTSPPGVLPSHTSNSSTSINSGPQHVRSVSPLGSDNPHQDNPWQEQYSAHAIVDQGVSAHWVEQLQLALAIANPELLHQLVLHCQSPLVSPHQLGAISATVSVPVDGAQAADSVLKVEVISCQLSQESTIHGAARTDDAGKLNVRSLDVGVNPCGYSPVSSSVNSSVNSAAEDIAHQRALVNQICRETKLQTLGMNIPLPEAIALLQYATFSLPDIQRILNLPYNGWHRSWWAMVDPGVDQTLDYTGVTTVGFTMPFKRLIRSRRYADGTVMLQYKDQFAHIRPPCFRTQQQLVLVHIQRLGQSISDILAWMNHARTTLKADHGLLLYHQLSTIEQQALRNQGIYLYHCPSSAPTPSSVTPSHVSDRDRNQHNPTESEVAIAAETAMSHEPIAHEAMINESITHNPVRADGLADCSICRQRQCPMHGLEASPVTACRLFRVD